MFVRIAFNTQKITNSSIILLLCLDHYIIFNGFKYKITNSILLTKNYLYFKYGIINGWRFRIAMVY